jgi:hypothetical protein
MVAHLKKELPTPKKIMQEKLQTSPANTIVPDSKPTWPFNHVTF